MFFRFARLILQPVYTPDLNHLPIHAVSQASLALTLFVGLMPIINAYIQTGADGTDISNQRDYERLN